MTRSEKLREYLTDVINDPSLMKKYKRVMDGNECNVYIWLAEEFYGDNKFTPPGIYDFLKPIILERMGENE